MSGVQQITHQTVGLADGSHSCPITHSQSIERLAGPHHHQAPACWRTTYIHHWCGGCKRSHRQIECLSNDQCTRARQAIGVEQGLHIGARLPRQCKEGIALPHSIGSPSLRRHACLLQRRSDHHRCRRGCTGAHAAHHRCGSRCVHDLRLGCCYLRGTGGKERWGRQEVGRTRGTGLQ